MIEELLQCRCGHGISSHSGSGCEGDRLRPCSCARSRVDVLEFAIADVRTEVATYGGGDSMPRYVSRGATT